MFTQRHEWYSKSEWIKTYGVVFCKGAGRTQSLPILERRCLSLSTLPGRTSYFGFQAEHWDYTTKSKMASSSRSSIATYLSNCEPLAILHLSRGNLVEWISVQTSVVFIPHPLHSIVSLWEEDPCPSVCLPDFWIYCPVAAMCLL